MKITIEVEIESEKFGAEITKYLQTKKLFQDSNCVGEIRLTQSCKSILSPNWEQAPDWAMWWAVDADSNAFWYEYKPIVGNSAWGNEILGGTWDFVKSKVDLAGIDWKTTLRHRNE